MSNQFETIISIIREGFQPQNITNESEAEKELMQFLNSRFPDLVFTPGHTSTGIKIDIVIEGTYAIELVTVVDEGRLGALMHQIIQSKDDFAKMAVVVLIDLNKIPSERLENYVNEYAKLNVKTIVKRQM